MANKALILAVDGPVLADGVYHLGVLANIEDGENMHTVNVAVTSANYNPLLPSWKTKIGDAVKAEALSLFSLTVDQVLFQDFQILSI